jgi:futalosine hydrolase
MNILLVSATAFEVEPFIKENPAMDVLIAGVGIPSTVFQLTRKLIQQEYDMVIQAGIAGTFHNKIEKSTVVVVERDIFGDLGSFEKNHFKTLFENGLLDEDDQPYKKGWLSNPNRYLESSDLKVVKGITVNSITDDDFRIDELAKKFDPDIETMEGAALHYVCLMLKVPFLQLRSISNAVGERDKGKWNIADAVSNLNLEIKNVIRNLS